MGNGALSCGQAAGLSGGGRGPPARAGRMPLGVWPEQSCPSPCAAGEGGLGPPRRVGGVHLPEETNEAKREIAPSSCVHLWPGPLGLVLLPSPVRR